MRWHPYTPALALAGLLVLAGCERPGTEPATPASVRAHAGAGSTEPTLDDAVITSLVKAALVAHDEVNGKNISVMTKQGHVILTGSVPARQIAQVEQLVRKVDGVRAVVNRLKPLGVIA